jgi:hypothetical protein
MEIRRFWLLSGCAFGTSGDKLLGRGFFNSLHHFLRRIGHRISGDNGHSGFGKRLLSGGYVVAFQADD